MQSYGFQAELFEVVRGYLESRSSFNAFEVLGLVEEVIEESGEYRDSIDLKKIKSELIKLFENGDMPGYCMVPRPVVDEEGVPKYAIEFEPINPMDPLDLILPPEETIEASTIKCQLHQPYRKLLARFAEVADCDEDTLARSILIRGLQLIYDAVD